MSILSNRGRHRLRALASRLDLAYSGPLVIAVGAFILVVLAYFGTI